MQPLPLRLLSKKLRESGCTDGAPINWDQTGGAVQDNPSRHDYNLDQMVDEFVQSAIKLQNITKLSHQMWPCGSDFQYQNADHW